MIPGKTYHFTLKEGLNGHDVWALQLNLNLILTNQIVEDGAFGPFTKQQVKAYQRNHGLVADGVAGLRTQQNLGSRLMVPAWRPFNLPSGLPQGLVESESSWAVGTVNWAGGGGGVDCGWIQDRVYFTGGGPEDIPDSRWRSAFDGRYAGTLIGSEFRERKDSYWNQRVAIYKGVTTHRRAWELAALAHNWPAGALKLAKGQALSEEPAEWVTNIGVNGVESPADWARFYIGNVTRYVTSYNP